MTQSQQPPKEGDLGAPVPLSPAQRSNLERITDAFDDGSINPNCSDYRSNSATAVHERLDALDRLAEHP